MSLFYGGAAPKRSNAIYTSFLKNDGVKVPFQFIPPPPRIALERLLYRL
ncbi:MAG: hypothetical protein LBG43_10905 [Treponema sp.]|nr:hypothetical protein [Treponema sp.]